MCIRDSHQGISWHLRKTAWADVLEIGNRPGNVATGNVVYVNICACSIYLILLFGSYEFRCSRITNYTFVSFQGPDNHRKPFMLVEILSLDIFDDEAKCRSYVPRIFDYLVSITEFTKEQIVTNFIPTYRHLLGMKGASLA